MTPGVIWQSEAGHMAVWHHTIHISCLTKISVSRRVTVSPQSSRTSCTSWRTICWVLCGERSGSFKVESESYLSPSAYTPSPVASPPCESSTAVISASHSRLQGRITGSKLLIYFISNQATSWAISQWMWRTFYKILRTRWWSMMGDTTTALWVRWFQPSSRRGPPADVSPRETDDETEIKWWEGGDGLRRWMASKRSNRPTAITALIIVGGVNLVCGAVTCHTLNCGLSSRG